MTPLSKKIDILSQVFSMTFDNDNYREFFEFNALVLYMCFLLNTGMVTDITDDGERYVNITWQNLLNSLDLTDTGFDSVDEMIGEKEWVA